MLDGLFGVRVGRGQNVHWLSEMGYEGECIKDSWWKSSVPSQPFFARAATRPSPIPLEPPVTTATFPLRSGMSSSLYRLDKSPVSPVILMLDLEKDRVEQSESVYGEVRLVDVRVREMKDDLMILVITYKG
jgi:hypothetical protein